MGVQDVDLHLLLSGVYTKVPLHATPVTITRGHDPYGSWPHPARIQCQIDNDDLAYDPTRPASLLYGVAGRNTEVRLRPVGVLPTNTAWFYAEATSWTPDATSDHVPGERKGMASVTLVAEGLQRRLGKWRDRLGSPLRRAVLLAVRSGTYDAAAYWPMEDPGGSGTAVSAIGGPAMEPVVEFRYTMPDGSAVPPGGAPRFADGKGVLGADPLVSFQGGGTLRGVVDQGGTWNGYTIDWVAQMPPGIEVGESVTVLSWQETGTYVYFEMVASKGSPSSIAVFHANAADRATFSSTGSASGSGELFDGTPHFFRYRVRQNGGSYLARLYIDGVLFATADNFTPGMTGTVGKPYLIDWNPLELSTPGMPIGAGHLIVWRSGQDAGQPGLTSAFNGHREELTQVRFDRVFEDESGFEAFFSAGGEQLGPQSSAPLLDQLKELQATDGGRIDDERFSIAEYFRLRRSLHAAASVLDLTYSQLTPPFRKVIDDLGIVNRVTVRNWDGEEVTATRETGPTSVLPPPNGMGEYPASFDVNVNDRLRLPHIANWRLARGGYELGQYREVTVDLVANPDLATAVQAVREGDHITVSGADPDVLHFMVVGIVRRITSGTHLVTFKVEPWGVWDVGIWDSPLWIWDAGTMTLNAGYSATATAWTFAFTNPRDVWTGNCDLMVGGERVTMTAHGALTGSGPYTQTATVTRAVNGVRKAQLAGTEVHAADARRWGL